LERNIIEELDSLALATRLKNLSERLAKDVAAIYKASDFDFEPRWFAVIYALKDGDELAVTVLAQMLQQTHPAVNQVANVLVKRKLVIESKDDADQRKRMLKLSESGLSLVNQMEPIWEKVQIANDRLIEESASSFLSNIKQIESALDQKSMFDRVNDLL
jgi:DNA-binding MarR family transcriptional regulator